MFIAFARRQYIGLEPEFLAQKGVSIVSSFHVLIDLRNRHDKVQVEVVDHVVDHAQKNNKS